MNKGVLLVVSGPSGVGKGTVIKRLMEQQDNLFYSVSVTTRKPREGEIDGVHYHFISRSEFQDLIAHDGLLEHAEYCGNYYGTPRKEVEQMLQSGKNVLLEIEPCGAAQVIRKCPDAISIFIMPPSMEELRCRLTGRGTEDSETIEKRLHTADLEMKQSKLYRYQVINDTIESAKAQIVDIINQNTSWRK